MKRLLILTTLLLITVASSAQGDSLLAKKIRYFNSTMMSGFVGKKSYGSTVSISTLHGVRVNNFAAGVGISYDLYDDWKIMPVFASVSYDVIRLKQNAIYLQVCGGYAKFWHIDDDNENIHYDEDDGAMFHPSMGYRIKTGAWSIYLNAGYRFQRIRYDETPSWLWGAPGNNVNHVKRSMERVTFGIGFGWK